MATGRFVSYLRVSTDRQGRSGLGLDAQRATVAAYLNGGSWSLIAEFVEVESGRNADRPELARALALCRAHRAALVVAKVDRLARSQAFLSNLLAAGVDVRFCDLPQIEGPTGRFLLQQMMSVAELEAGLISARTKAALAAAKARGQRLGGFRGRAGTADDTARARAARTRQADEHAAALEPILLRIDPAGTASLRMVAAALSAEHIPTPSGRGAWTAAAVARLRARMASA
ncbi:MULTISPECIES: recombinase family protein [Methylorubrum]|uniref:recombinase family protein n=1 Tax=Methylorubrum TaxID=2282523 RepID=UPI00209EA312|nr:MULTISPECIES: recombinase family protein [Methylorubrum]MCP1546983.1 DNA invertase Pin-like site-specific DNA recombinase [Methylorubrum zatmanii]MCP1551738.1 DNA invertase Pin-like site-specific DNA recombinase [Methylorubrum extorquens]MCP1577286.1 DNA invertase Pin-like site-specific DNA recombinase [Methylorubrum extorquens]